MAAGGLVFGRADVSASSYRGDATGSYPRLTSPSIKAGDTIDVSMKIRTYLLVFALAILVPMIAFSVIAVLAFDRQQRTVVERAGVETARALMNAVDRELTTSITALETLATARSLERDDFPSFYDDARRVIANQPEWSTIILLSPAGERLLDLGYPVGSPLTPAAERESLERAVQTREPAVGTLALGPLKRLAFPVRVPIVRKDAVVYVLTGVLKPSAVDEILSRQKLPAEWIGTIFDSRRTVVARTSGIEQFIGRQISPEFAAVLDTAREGWTVTHTLENVAMYTAFSRSEITGWGVGLGIPLSAVDGPLRRSLWLIAGGGLAFLIAAVAASALIGKRITRPVAAVATAATAFGEQTDASFSPPVGGPAEVEAVARAFTEASALLRARATERDEALARAHATRAEAEAANRAKDEFLAVLSHELRTPLNAVYGWARMLRTRTLGSAAAEHALDVIERNAAAQVRLIEEILDISRIVTGNMRLQRQPVDLQAVVTSALDSVRPAVEAKSIRMEASIDPAAAPITGDPDRLRQVIWNLVSNAIKFTPSGGLVQVEARRVGADVEVTVRDTGRGIAPEILPYVFDRFRQADSTSTREHGGLGLGLALVRHLVELHGGTVTAASAGEGQGATFVVTLPANAGAGDGVIPKAGSPARSLLEGVRILALGDTDQGREILATVLRSAGGTVKTCAPAEGITAVSGFRPHVIVADVGTPGEEGYAFVRALRSRSPEEGGLTPAAALTASPDEARRLLQSGFQMHVSKPIDPGRLVAAITALASDGRPSRPRV
jgi:signal transduction histidine kinase/CheY-like chemotaxis protein